MNLFDAALLEKAPRQEPLEVAPETFVIRLNTPAFGGTWSNQSSMVIRCKEPMIVDTGIVTGRETWCEDVFSLVEPEDVRWIFVSHIDTDHSGNLQEAVDRCPNAKVITSRSESFRMGTAFDIPYERMHMVDNGQTFEIAGRTFLAVRPPAYDSPYTRGLFDTATGVYYAVDAFCTQMPSPVDWVAQIASDEWAEGMARYHHYSLCPWVALADPAAFRAEVDKLAALGMTTIVSAHSPTIQERYLAQAFEQLATLPTNVPPPPTLKS